MSNFQGYTLSYKTDEGSWKTIPILYTTMYEAYKAACIDKGVDYVSEEVYLTALVNLVDTVKELTTEDGIVTIAHGGTSANSVEDARTNLEVYSKDETLSEINKALYGSDMPEEDLSPNSFAARVKSLEETVASMNTKLTEWESERTNKTFVNLDDLGIYISDNATPITEFVDNAQIIFEY